MDLLNLPVELFLQITNTLNIYDLLSLSETSHTYYALVKFTFREYVAIYKRLKPILIIEKNDSNFQKIVDNIKDMKNNGEESYDTYRFLTAYNESWIVNINYVTARRDKDNDPRTWYSGEYRKFVDSITFKKGESKFIFNSKQSCIDFILKHNKENLLDIYENNNIELFKGNSDDDDNPKTKEETYERIKNDIELKNRYYWNSCYSFYNVEIIKLDTNNRMKLYVKGHWNHLIGQIDEPKYKKSNYISYITHDNGSRPFMVVHNTKKNKVIIYKHMFLGDNERIFKKLYGKKKSYDIIVAKYDVKRVMPGIEANDKYNGNSVLLDLGDNRYVFIGGSVYEFSVSDTIQQYNSLMGNSNVHYPVAIGCTYAYFMLDQVFIKLTEFPENCDYPDLYSYFYGHKGEPYNKRMVGDRFLGYEDIHLRDF